MSPITSRLVILFALISSITSALATPQLLKHLLAPIINPLNGLTILKNAPPQLMTKDPSPECAKTNQGALLCCESTFDGGFPLVRELSELTGYELSNDTINGIYCTKTVPCTLTQLCCQVDQLASLPVVDNVISLALFCRHT